MQVVVLKTESPHTLWVKETNCPVMIQLYFPEPMKEDLLHQVLLAGPWYPIKARVSIGEYTDQGFTVKDFSLVSSEPIKKQPKPNPPQRKGYMQRLPPLPENPN